MRATFLALPAFALGAGALALTAGGPSWTDAELATVRSFAIDALAPPPPDPSNRVADDPRAAELGRAFFFDTGFSPNGEVACATCHLADRQFQDDRPLAQGVGRTDRRTMPIAGTAYAPFLFWDGRKDSLWSQALGPLESAVEHGGDRTFYARFVAEQYRAEYEAVFGAMPDLSNLPARAGPIADPEIAAAWDGLPAADRGAVDTVFANVGKAIASYERTIRPAETRFDAWVGSDEFPRPGLLTEGEIAGLRLFIGEAECVNCHNGPLFTDNHFHNTGVPAAPGLPDDRGREPAIRLVQEDPFNCLGSYSDAAPDECTELRFMAGATHEAVRAFKTPSLRGAADRPPYMHAGQLASLDEVLAHYAAAPEAPAGHSELRKLDLDLTELNELEAFLETLMPLESPTGAEPGGTGEAPSNE